MRVSNALQSRSAPKAPQFQEFSQLVTGLYLVDRHPHKQIQDEKGSHNDEEYKEDADVWIAVQYWLLINPHSIHSIVHYHQPHFERCHLKECQHCHSYVVKINCLVDPPAHFVQIRQGRMLFRFFILEYSCSDLVSTFS